MPVIASYFYQAIQLLRVGNNVKNCKVWKGKPYTYPQPAIIHKKYDYGNNYFKRTPGNQATHIAFNKESSYYGRC